MPLVTLDTITTDQLKGLLDVREGKNLPYELWRELHLLDLVTIKFGSSKNAATIEDILTDSALELLGELAQ